MLKHIIIKKFLEKIFGWIGEILAYWWDKSHENQTPLVNKLAYC